jgi:hypothetical protein
MNILGLHNKLEVAVHPGKSMLTGPKKNNNNNTMKHNIYGKLVVYHYVVRSLLKSELHMG